nr:MAG TPA: hypothetical protein [Caudoviricetes sp.]
MILLKRIIFYFCIPLNVCDIIQISRKSLINTYCGDLEKLIEFLQTSI